MVKVRPRARARVTVRLMVELRVKVMDASIETELSADRAA